MLLVNCYLSPADVWARKTFHIYKGGSGFPISSFYTRDDYNPANDVLSSCIEYDSYYRKYFLYFKLNDLIIRSLEPFNYSPNVGEIELNFHKYEYLFTLSSVRCDCCKSKNVKGFEFQICFG